ncbi:hypothetical protein MLGJGCBP_04706 [Rhodococcus sp. T7]|nr:hypothetical protein MLGJGCBP_04706 [Rhodococcus sp. T7]
MSVSGAVVGDGAQLFLDGFEGGAGGGSAGEGVVEVDAGEVEADGVEGGEPADGAGEVGTGDQGVVPAVAFHSDQCAVGGVAAAASEGADCEGEGREQCVVDSAVEPSRDIPQKCLGDLG